MKPPLAAAEAAAEGGGARLGPAGWCARPCCLHRARGWELRPGHSSTSPRAGGGELPCGVMRAHAGVCSMCDVPILLGGGARG